MILKKFLRFRYAAIKRYGDRSWTAAAGEIEFNPNYTVNCGGCEKDVAFYIDKYNQIKNTFNR